MASFKNGPWVNIRKEKKRLFLIITLYVLVITTLFSVGMSSLHSGRTEETQKLMKSLISETVRIEASELPVEIFLGQIGAIKVRMESIQSKIKEIAPKNAVCVHSETGKVLFPSNGFCTQASFEHSLILPLKEGAKQVGSVSVFYSDYISWKDTFLSYRFQILAFFAAFLLLIFFLFFYLKKYLNRMFGRISNAERIEQIVHEFKSPIALFKTTLSNDSEVMQKAVLRMEELSESLLKGYSPSSLKQEEKKLKKVDTRYFVNCAVKEVVEDKRRVYENTGVTINFTQDPKHYELFFRGSREDFKHAIGNLIDNSAEALKSSDEITNPTVDIKVTCCHRAFSVIVEDNGPGIPEKISDKLGERGVTYGKPNGNGLGLFNVFTYVKKMGIKYAWKSNEPKGTWIRLNFQRSLPPAWFMKKIMLIKSQTVLVLDDQESFFEVWNYRLRKIKDDIKVVYKSSNEAAEKWIRDNPDKLETTFFICDYELIGSSLNGQEFIKKHKLESQSVVATHREKDFKLLSRFSTENIKYIPKSIVPFIPVELVAFTEYDSVLIDDNDSAHHCLLYTSPSPRD